MKDLPRTIQDAVSVTRQLKLEYLWVDSMCIIQDNAEDKSALLGQMHKIYACGHVTIAASKAAKCTEGFLAPRYDVPGFSIPIRYPSASDSVPRLGSVILMPSSRRSVEPLVTRAWTLQESLLSRRILSYGNRQLRWYCASGDEQCDGGVLDRNSANFASFQSLEETVIDYPRRRMEVKSLPHDPTSLPWLEIVEQYTMRGLSVSSDKLIAISAVAQRLVSLTQGKWGRYYAGIWEERFFEQLLWAMSTGEITKRPAEYRAPSWSWAAIDGRPKWPWTEHLVDAKISCKLLGVETETSKSEQSFGAVSAGKLRLFGRLKKATWSADRRTIRDSKTQASVTGGSMQTFPDALDDSAQETTVYILEVARRSYIADTMAAFNLRRRSHAGKYVAGLVLKHCGGKVYQRVGFIGLKSKKINTIVLATGWDTVENKSWWSEGFNEMEITIT
ncbi:hypothetical protein N0V86_007829 [Didymella sp. IMI 355093]|nr:hypothetical protein N0V86_007829 [Didymella sp. IMI 355093]